MNYVERTPDTLVAGVKNSRKKMRINKKSSKASRRSFLDEAEPNGDKTSILPNDKVTVKSRTSWVTFRENNSNYKSSGSYVPRKIKAHRKLLAEQKSISDLNFKNLGILPDLQPENYWTRPKIPVQSQNELSQVETATFGPPKSRLRMIPRSNKSLS